MKLYYAPGACSFAPHIALLEANLPVELVKVDLASHTLGDGTDFYSINPKGGVPVLELDDGTRLTEAAVILQYIADQRPGTLAPEYGSFERYRLIEWLNYIATELHKGMGPLWYPATTPEVREQTIAGMSKRFTFIARALEKSEFIAGDRFSIADAYLHTILGWTRFHKIDLTPWPALVAYQERMRARPAVQEAKHAESGAAPKQPQPA